MRKLPLFISISFFIGLLSCNQPQNDNGSEVVEDSLESIETTSAADSMLNELNALLDSNAIIVDADTTLEN